MGWPILGMNPGRVKRFSFLQNVQTRFGAHPACYSMGTQDVALGIKQLEAWG
jgi:hypothetical protein